MAERPSDAERGGLDEKEDVERSEIELRTDPRITAFTPKEQRSIIWRVDRRLVLTLGFLYMISLMDRTNLGAAAIAGYVTA